jgi:hypothetical protein
VHERPRPDHRAEPHGAARIRDEIAEARASWQADDDRLGLTGSPLEPITAPGLPRA